MTRKFNWLFPLALGVSTAAFSETVSVEIHPTSGAGLPKHMGAAVSPKQGRMEWDAMSLLKNGKPWLPVMGEIHFSRYPAAEWRDELLKMKAGGITMISTYVFWIYHEEERGKFTWDGDKDLRKFIQTCAEVGLPVIVRVGPWCHGEVRNGGFPDWVQAMPHKRANDPEYLAAVKTYYMQVGQQLNGLYWKDDGPIIGIQFENEFAGPAAHLATLKEYGLAAGMDVPIYTRTAWDNATEYPGFGQVLPLWGGYAEGFWDRTLDTMPGNYWQVFQFAVDRAPGNAMGADPNAVAALTPRGAYPGRRLWLVLDKHGSHDAARSRKLAQTLGIELLWLPTQSPELNPMDHLWRETKRTVSANWQYDTVEQHAQAAEKWLLSLSDRQALRKAGILSKNFWLVT